MKVNLPYILAIFAAVIFTWLLHEFTHWAVSQILGYETIMTLNGTHPVEDNYVGMRGIIVSAAGPLVTVIQAMIVYFYFKLITWNKYLYPFLFTAFYMRLLAAGMNVIHLNDEGRISEAWGLGTYTISIIVSILLFLMVLSAIRVYKITWKFQLVTILMIIFFSSVLILADQAWQIRIL